MTALRPERDTGTASGAGPQGSPYGAGQQRWYGDGAPATYDETAVLPPYAADGTTVRPSYAEDGTAVFPPYPADETALLPPYGADTPPHGTPPYGTPPGPGAAPYGGPLPPVAGPAGPSAPAYGRPAGSTPGSGYGGPGAPSSGRTGPAGPTADGRSAGPAGPTGPVGPAAGLGGSHAYGGSPAPGPARPAGPGARPGVPGPGAAGPGAAGPGALGQAGPAAGDALRARPARHVRPVDGGPESPVGVRAPAEEPGVADGPRAAAGDDETMALGPSAVAEAQRRAAAVGGAAVGGRAERRKAAKRHGRRPAEQLSRGPDGAAPPLSRVEARRAARSRRPGTGVLVSRAVGELFITAGVLMLLFVTYQLWWSNVRAHQEAGSAAEHLQQDWASGKRAPGVFEPGQGFAILHIPKLDVVAPIAEGVSKTNVLDKGMVGHYGEGTLKTAMPDAKTGNFGLAAHRNTHGEPFRYINRLKAGDSIVVETQDTYYVYKMASVLPVTSPSNTAVLDPVPAGSGFTKAGRYITLTTCTPEFTSKYRLIVWGKMVEERPRSKGKPDALVQ